MSSALNQQNEFTYDYRADGLRSKLTIANQSQPFTWTYTNAGRELTQADPVTGTYMPAMGNFTAHTLIARTQTYDSYGQLSSIELPDHGTYASITHDTEGNMTTFQVKGDDITPSSSLAIAAQYGYDVRGEQTTTDTMTPGQGVYEPFSSSTYLYGHNCSIPPIHAPISTDCAMYSETTGTHTYNVPAQVVDPYTGAGQSGGSLYIGYNNSNCPNSRVYAGSLTFDYDGRQTGESLQSYNCISVTTTTEDARSYDAENHVISDSADYDASAHNGDGIQPGYSTPGATYSWNALGRARVVNDQGYNAQATEAGAPAAACSPGPYTLHWDGDDLLFITNSSGALVQVNAEKLGGQGFGCASGNSLGAFRVINRDVSGTEVGFHSAMGESPWVILPAHSKSLGKIPGNTTCALTCVGVTTSIAQLDFTRTLLFNAPRQDGYMIGNVNVQGVRAYDPTTAQWSSPDAYKGDVHDPMSQRSYMWNDNNPIAYSDPSGYVADWTQAAGMTIIFIPVRYTGPATRAEQAAMNRVVERTFSGQKVNGTTVETMVVPCQSGGMCNTINTSGRITMGGACSGANVVGCGRQPGTEVQMKLTGNGEKDGTVAAHELGHGMGLSHSRDAGNLMYRTAGSTVTAAQIKSILNNRANKRIR